MQLHVQLHQIGFINRLRAEYPAGLAASLLQCLVLTAESMPLYMSGELGGRIERIMPRGNWECLSYPGRFYKDVKF